MNIVAMAKVCNKIETCKDFAENFKKKTKRVLLSILLWLNICILVLFLLPLHCRTKAL
nr:MAG TPA: hypothetical protein [Caudoviricetes sp.]